MTQLWMIFFCILIVFVVSRLITFMVLKWKILPYSTLSNGRRVHHFVYGNNSNYHNKFFGYRIRLTAHEHIDSCIVRRWAWANY